MSVPLILLLIFLKPKEDHPDSIYLIKTALFDEDAEVIENAVVALYNLNGPDILYEILKDEKYPQVAKNKASEIFDEYEN